ELLLELAATPEQFNCPFLYTSSRAGTATFDLQTPGTDLKPLFETILTTIPAPRADPRGPLQMLVSTLDYSSYLGRIAIGRIERARMHVGDTVAVLPLGGAGHGRGAAGRGAGAVGGRGVRASAGREAVRLRGTRAGGAGGGRRRRDRGVGGARRRGDREDDHGARPPRAPRGDRSGGAHDLGGLQGQRLAVRRARREVHHRSAAAGAAVPGARAERGPPGGGDGRPPDVHRVGTRRAAPRR